MKKLVFIAAAAALLSGPAVAQSTNEGKASTATGMVGGAATGAILGGPIGPALAR